MNARLPAVSLSAFVLLLLLAVIAVVQLKPVTITSDMLALLDGTAADTTEQKAFYQAQQALLAQGQSRLVFSFSGQGSLQAYVQLEAALTEQNVEVQTHQGDLQQIIDFYSPYQGALMSQGYRQAIGDPAKFADYFSRQLSQASSPWLSHSVAQDPSLATYSFVSKLGETQHLSLVDGKLRTLDKQGKPIWLLIANSPVSGSAINESVSLAQNIKAAIATITAKGPNVDIRYSGVLFHNAENAEQAKWEMNRFGLVSLLLLTAFVVMFLRGVAPLWISALTVASALLSGLLALLLLRTHIHLITLVFATTLIGVAIDYAFHAMADKASHDQQYSAKLKRGLMLALCSTSIGYLCFLTAPIAMLQDVAVFVIAGLLGAWVFVRFFVPLTAVTFSLRGRVSKCADTATRWQHSARRHARSVALSITALCVIAYVIKPITINDAISSFNASSDSLVASQRAHERYLTGATQAHRVIVRGTNLEQLLQNEEVLSDWLASKDATAYGLSSVLPSAQRQRASLQLYKQATESGVFAPIAQFTGQPLVAPDTDILHYDEFLQGPLASSMALPIAMQQQWYSMLNVSAVDVSTLSAYCASHQVCAVVDVAEQLSSMLAHFHSSIHWALIIALVAIFAIFMVCFGISAGLRMCLWLALSTAFIITLINVYVPISVFHTLGLILVLALAVDYFIFYQQGGYSSHTFAAISLSALSSLAVFAMLVFSKTPAISQFGAAVLVGLIVVYLLAPMSIENNNER